MSTRFCYFGVPASTTIESVRAAAAAIWDVLDDGPAKIYLLTQPPERVGAVRWFGFAGSDGRLFERDTFIETLEYDLPELLTACHDDMNGIYLFRSRGLSLLSDGPYVGVLSGEIEVDYPQKPFDRAALEAIHEKAEDAMTDAEARAVMDWDDAVTIALRQLHPEEPRRSYLSVGNGPTFALGGAGDPVEARDALPLVAHFPEPRDWARAGLPPRY